MLTAYKGVFTKKDGSERTMLFVRLEDLPEEFLASKINGTGTEKTLPAGMELVWDLEADNFRVFNHSTASKLEEMEIIADQFDY